jgi:hypothetical protein
VGHPCRVFAPESISHEGSLDGFPLVQRLPCQEDISGEALTIASGMRRFVWQNRG